MSGNEPGDERGSADDASVSPAEVTDAARQLDPAGQMAVVNELYSAVMMHGSIPNPIHQKVNEKHIESAIQLAAAHDERQHALLRGDQQIEASNRYYALTVFVLILAFVGFLLVVFQDKPTILLPTLTGVFGFGAGAMAGYGYGKSKT